MYYYSAALCCIVLVSYVLCVTTESQEITLKVIKQPDLPEYHTFVALIDIVFTDGSKRTCTGTIIHENVVITVAHCFIQEYNPEVKPELTLSFVVIGNKKMFETNYEQYLPIERIVTHPKFKAWTADLSLVFTFAAMTSDKPGTVIPLAGDREFAPVDSNVTVLSWGHCKDEIEKMKMKTPTQKRKTNFYPCAPGSTSCEGKGKIEVESFETGTVSLQELRSEMQFENYKEQLRKQKMKAALDKLRPIKRNYSNESEEYNRPLLTSKNNVPSRYLFTAEKDAGYDMKTIQQRNLFAKKVKESIKNTSPAHKLIFVQIDTSANGKRYADDYKLSDVRPFDVKSYYRNWRRQMGTQQNELIVESFDLMNIQMCKKIIQKAMPAIYAIKHGNDVLCFSSEHHYITAEDAGAPAIRNGQLVAVTVGGAECDGDRVALGIKMSCYCSWIAMHLPGGGEHLKCCRNCCVYNEGDDDRSKSYKNVHLVDADET